MGSRSLQCREDGVDRGNRVVEVLVGGRCVGDVQDEVQREGFLERRREALHELVRKAANESDGVGHEIPPTLVREAPRRRVERSKRRSSTDAEASVSAFRRVDLPVFVSPASATAGAPRAVAPCAACPGGARALQPAPELADPPASEPPVRLELRLTGAPRPDRPKALEVCARPRIRGRLYSGWASSTWSCPPRWSPVGEDVEDQLRPVDDA